MNEREQEEIDAELATSDKERSEKQQSKKGVDWTKMNGKGEKILKVAIFKFKLAFCRG